LKKPVGKKVSLENKLSAYNILNNRIDFPDLKEFLSISISRSNKDFQLNQLSKNDSKEKLAHLRKFNKLPLQFINSIKLKNKLFDDINENNLFMLNEILNDFFT